MVSLQARLTRFMIRVGMMATPNLSLAERRSRIERLSERARLPEGTTIEPVDAGGVRAEWVATPNTESDLVLLYAHGGAFCLGSPRSHRGLVARICAESAARGLSIDYRLAPEHRFPAAVDDCVTAYRWLVANGSAPARIVIGGDSAGGNLALAALVRLRDEGDELPAAAICLSPATDLSGSGESVVTRARLDPMLQVAFVLPLRRAYVGDDEATNPLASPLFADLRGLPPLLIQVGTHEILHDDSVRFAAKARDAGVDVRLDVWSGMWHVWQVSAPWVPEANRAIAEIGRFVRGHAFAPTSTTRRRDRPQR